MRVVGVSIYAGTELEDGLDFAVEGGVAGCGWGAVGGGNVDDFEVADGIGSVEGAAVDGAVVRVVGRKVVRGGEDGDVGWVGEDGVRPGRGLFEVGEDFGWDSASGELGGL